MSAATILTLLGIVNGLITLAKSTPAITAHAKALLATVEPYVQDAGVEVATEFVAAQQRLEAL